jgi:enhancer of polycomb-like protein
VPAPPTEESKDIKYDELYTLEFPNPTTYIRFSQTVEECTGCQYNMTSEDDAYLRSFNAKRPPSSQCSEDNFERIMEVFESTADRQAPFAAVDNTVVTFDVMESALKDELEEEVHSFAKDIYDYWRSRRQATSNKGLQPTLKFEIHQDSDDADPYVCFRRRDVRQTRKTRARDVQITDKLRRLRKELEEGRQLVVMAHQREKAKRDLIALDRQIFEQRAKVKDIRLRLNIKGDDEDLINQKVSSRTPARPSGFEKLTNSSLRSERRPKHSQRNARQERNSAFLFVRMVGLSMQTWYCCQTYWPRKRIWFRKKLTRRSPLIKNGIKTMST